MQGVGGWAERTQFRVVYKALIAESIEIFGVGDTVFNDESGCRHPLSSGTDFSLSCMIFVEASIICMWYKYAKYLNTLNFICKDSDNYGIIVKFASRIMIVYESSFD